MDTLKDNSEESTLLWRRWPQLAVGLSVGRNLALMDNNHLSMVPELTQPGDEIWFAAGFQIPFAFCLTPNGKYELLGDVYVHGATHWEALNELVFEDIKLQ